MKILLTGANGQVGRKTAAASVNHEVLALDADRLDITDFRAVRRALAANGADAVINAAAYTAVDRAEQESHMAFSVNRDGPAHLARACAELSIPLLHISTDYVFDGTKIEPYREDDPAHPLSVYGRSKWEGEQAVRQILAKHIILRVSWIFSEHGHNFVKTILRLARERDELRVVTDQHGCPTYAGDIAQVLLVIADRIFTDEVPPWGTYHYCGTPVTTWQDFAQFIVDSVQRYESLNVTEIAPIATADYPTSALRPLNSVLDCTAIRRHFGIELHPWSSGLNTMLRTLYA